MSTERLTLALDGGKTAILDWDMVNKTLYISPNGKKMLGYSDSELPTSIETWKELAHPEDVKKNFRSFLQHRHKHLKTFEHSYRIRHRHGHWICIFGRAQIIYDAEGHAVRMIGTQTDITKEKELQFKYSHYAQIIEQIHDSVISLDKQGNITSWNKGSEMLFGYSADEMIGRHFSLLCLEEKCSLQTKSIAALEQYGEYKTEIQLKKRSGEPLFVELVLSPLKDNEGKRIGIVSYAHDITDRKEAEERLVEQKRILFYQAHHDALTGLPNRVLFFDRLEQSIRKTERLGSGFALFFIDLDRFKHINDSLGHSIGDRVLRITAKRIGSILRQEDTLARLSGDEFTVIMEDLHHPADASYLAEKILAVLQKPMYIDEYTLYISGSIGISLYPEDAADAEDLLKYADTAMYRAKANGRNMFQFYAAAMTAYAIERMEMKTSLKEAIEKEEFVLYYQPQVDALTGHTIGLEALVRWQHPSRGLILPDQFIPLAEETGLIVDIDRWVMKTAMQQVSLWHKEGLIPDMLALNLSIKQLEGHHFLQEIEHCLNAFEFQPHWLELEIPEGQVMKDHKETIAKLQKVHDMGIGISIDDFGTGYSSLSLLKRLPINLLKIDRSFIKDIPFDEEDMAIVKAIIALAGSLKLEIIAEGVETEEQKAFLVENGCTKIQGFYYSKPLSQEKMHHFLQKQF